ARHEYRRTSMVASIDGGRYSRCRSIDAHRWRAEDMTEDLPVVVIGAGPSGLAAAAHLLDRGLEPVVVEAGPSAGTSVREWHHVRLFSRWGELVDPAAEKLLAPTGCQAPDADRYPTGADWAERYLQPLADALGDQVRFGARVVGVARR